MFNIRYAYSLFTDILGITPFHPQFFSRRFINHQIMIKAKQATGIFVDFGCGSGPYRKHFSRSTYFGSDYPSPFFAVNHNSIDFFSDLKYLPISDACLDGAICTQVLEHIREPATALAEISRALKPGGKLLLTVPFFYPLHDEPYDFFRYTPYGLTGLLNAAGLKPIELVPQGGFFSMFGEFLNLFLVHKTLNLLTSKIYKKLFGFVLVPIVLIFSFINNIVCLSISPLDQERRFVMNYFIFAEKLLNE